MQDFIFELKHSLSNDLCETIILMFELEENHYEGVIVSGVDKNVKNTVNFGIPRNTEIWNRVELELKKALDEGIAQYNRHHLKEKYNYNFFENNELIVENFEIQKYTQNEGIYIYHNDFHIKKFSNKMSYRILTFIWYLNDVNEGGETEFLNVKIKPEKGKLVLFPASWIFPHKANIPKSSDKYIITGWFYVNHGW